MKIEDAGNTVAMEHDTILFLRIWSAIVQINGPIEDDVVFGGRALQGHDIGPEGVNLVGFGEETMTADVDAVAVVFDGL